MSIDDGLSLFDTLYKWFKKNSLYKNQTDFLLDILPKRAIINKGIDYPTCRSRIYKNDVFPEYVIDFFLDSRNTDILSNHFTEFVNRINGRESELIQVMLDTIKIKVKTNCNEMINHLEILYKERNFSTCLNHYLYFCITKSLPPNVVYKKYPNLENDINEYVREVLLKFGSSGMPGIRAIRNLANRQQPNIIALYEAGEIEFYGRQTSGKQDYEAAYRYYERAWNNLSSHPLAGWSIGYILYKYNELNAKIDMFDNLPITDRYRLAISYFTESERFGCAQSANSLGNIVLDKNVTKELKVNLQDAEYYFRKASNLGYSYGKNNYASLLRRKAEEESNDITAISLCKQSFSILKESADMGNAWASNKIGLFYYNGINERGKVVIESDHEAAFRYFNNAILDHTEEACNWARYNLATLFYLNDSNKKYLNDPEIFAGRLLLQASKSNSEELRIKCHEELKKLKQNKAPKV